jgi:hypothetical protein
VLTDRRDPREPVVRAPSRSDAVGPVIQDLVEEFDLTYHRRAVPGYSIHMVTHILTIAAVVDAGNRLVRQLRASPGR